MPGRFDIINFLAYVVLVCTVFTLLFSTLSYVASRRRTLKNEKEKMKRSQSEGESK